MPTATKPRPEKTPHVDHEHDAGELARVTAEQQLATDRQLASKTLRRIARGITLLDNNPTYETCQRLGLRLAQLQYLEHRITQTELMHTALWCQGCAAEGIEPVEFPGNPWMVFHCLDHATDQLERSGRSWARSLFGEVMQ